MALIEQRLPPQNLEAEQSVLGGILIDNQAFNKVVDVVSPEDFYRPNHRKIFEAMCELGSKGEPIDAVTLTAKLKELGVYEEVGGATYLAELLERVPTAIHVEYHARLVANQAVKRNLVSLCGELGNRGLDPSETTEELLDDAEKRIFMLTSSKKQRSILPIRDIVRDAFVELEKRFENQNELTGIPTGFIELDKITLGLQPSDLIIVACRPSMGKTSFALGVSRFAAIHTKRPIVFFSLEMAKEQIVTRLLAAEAKVDSTRIRSGKLLEQDWASLTRAAGGLSEAHVYIDDTPALTVLEMRGKARRLKAELGDLALVVVDYLQIMGTNRYAESREKAISDISRSLKALAKELHVPVLALSQLNRNIDLRNDKRPMLADLRESGAIEQDADLIIFIHREEVENLQPNAASVAEFIVGKHRNGPRGTVKVAWLGQYACFENLASNPT
ncbi:MAG: replicative DNA helicase [Deltaproteobacteria bacterium]|nr:replicative DNA helicase [Deltaproteobacteria bacterium]